MGFSLPKWLNFNTGNMWSVSQRTAKLPAVKLWEWFEPRQTRNWAEYTCMHFAWNGWNNRLFLENSNFDRYRVVMHPSSARLGSARAGGLSARLGSAREIFEPARLSKIGHIRAKIKLTLITFSLMLYKSIILPSLLKTSKKYIKFYKKNLVFKIL